jgi:branched-subunit amino acid aminotransferase/4-amino-4-deoxychorismate lyase
MKNIYWIDGDAPNRASIFETFRTYRGRGFKIEEHLMRLQSSAHLLKVSIPSLDSIHAEWVNAINLASQSLGPNCSFRYTVSADGRSELSYKLIDESYVNRPIDVALFICPPSQKHPRDTKNNVRASWLKAVDALDVDEVILCDPQTSSDVTTTNLTRGHEDQALLLLEANRSNLFALKGRTLVTPPLDGRLLPGVTRGALIEYIQGHHPFNLDVIESSISRGDSIAEGQLHWDALCLVSTLKEISLVRSFKDLNGAVYPCPSSPLIASLQRGFHRFISGLS